jgi:hypothetical protein
MAASSHRFSHIILKSMKFKYWICIWISFTFFYILGCSPPPFSEKGGKASITIYDQAYKGGPLKKSERMHGFNIWYSDSTVIEEITVDETNIDSFGKHTFGSYIDHYTFINFTTGLCYDYHSFSDTSKYFQKYSIDDRSKHGGFNFRNYLRIRPAKPTDKISDTTINNVEYQRYIVHQNGFQDSSSPVDILAFARCDKKGNLLDFGWGFDERKDCPIVRMDYLPTNINPFVLSFRIEFQNNTLSNQEQKIFAAWKIN